MRRIGNLNNHRLIAAVSLCSVLTHGVLGCARRGSDVLEVWEPTNHAVRVRIKKFNQWPQYAMAKYYFAIEAVTPATSHWDIDGDTLDDPGTARPFAQDERLRSALGDRQARRELFDVRPHALTGLPVRSA